MTAQIKRFAAGTTASLSTAAAAESPGWTFAAAPYPWVPGVTSAVDTAWGTVEADVSTGDVPSVASLLT